MPDHVRDGFLYPMILMAFAGGASWVTWVSVVLWRSLERLKSIDDKMLLFPVVQEELEAIKVRNTEMYSRMDERMKAFERDLFDAKFEHDRRFMENRING